MKYLLSAILVWGATTMSLFAESRGQAKSIVLESRVSSIVVSGKGKQGTPQEINYQGWLGDASDTAGISDTLNMIFRLYNAEIGGTVLWFEIQNNVKVNKGIFNVILGSGTLIPPTIFMGAPLWLETQVESDTLTPRKKLVSVGYAIKSIGADIAIYADTANKAKMADTANYVSGVNVDGEVAKANKADTADYALAADVSIDSVTYADTAGYAISADVGIVDSANVAANAWNWNNNSWGTEYPKANIADTANHVDGADVDGEVAQANYADTAGYASSSAPDNDWTISGSKLYAQDTSWNVGIGTTSPSTGARLHVEANGAWYGVYGVGSTDKTAGVYGEANGANYGVYGQGSAGKETGVFGNANGANYGVYGQGYTGKMAGVFGLANDAVYGVYGQGSDSSTAGMYGYANGADYGVYGRGNTDKTAGVYGWGSEYGVYGKGSAGKSAGVYGNANGANYGVYYSGGLAGTGTKSAVVRTSKGPTEMYCIEATELWFEDFGTGRLVNGQAQIDLAKDFLETVTIDGNNPMKVFIQLADDCNGVYVKKGLTSFEVMELGSGTSNAIFDYRIVAKRKNYETRRMKVVESCYTDKLLYSDDNDPAIPLKWRKVRQEQSEAEIKAKEAGTK